MALGVEVEGVAVRDKARRNQKANKIQATTRPAPNFLRSLLLSGWQQRPFYFLTTVPSSALYLEAGQGLFYWGGGGATPTACKSFKARDRTCATAVTQATAVTVPDP